MIVREGLRRMYAEGDDVCYYLTVGNEPYEMPEMPAGVEHDILKGLYRLSGAEHKRGAAIKLLGSGAILNEVREAQRMLRETFDVDCEVWGAPSYQQLHREGLEVERWNLLHPGSEARLPHARRCFGDDPKSLVVAASDYVKALPHTIRDWVPGRFVALGTDGFGRSEGRAALRDWFEVDARHVAWATLSALHRDDRFDKRRLTAARKKLEIDPDKADAYSL